MKSSALTTLALSALFVGLIVTAPVDAQRRGRESRQAAKAEPQYPDATRKEPNLTASSRFSRPLGKMGDLVEKEQFDQVIAEADKLVAEPRANAYEKAIALQYAGSAWLEQDNYAQAIDYFQRALEADGLPNDSHYAVMSNLVQLQMAEEQYEPALETIERFLVETKSNKPEMLAMKANAMYRLERFAEAAETMRTAIDGSDKPQPSWSQILMASYFEMDQPAEAAKIAEQLYAQNPDDKTILLNLSSIYLQADMMDKAAAVLDDARGRGMLTTERDYQQLYRVYLNMEGREKDAIEVIREGLDKGVLKPSHEVFSLLGQAYYFSDQIPQAIDAYREASKHADNGETTLTLARILYNEERFAEGKAAATEALQKGLKRPGDAYVILGNIEFYGLDNKPAGIAAFEKAATYPETKDQAESWLRQARRR